MKFSNREEEKVNRMIGKNQFLRSFTFCWNEEGIVRAK